MLVSGMFHIPPFIPHQFYLSTFFISSFSFLGTGLLVKHLYNISVNQEDNIHVVIYGAELNGSVLKKTIEQTSNNRYKIVAFIDDDENLVW